MNKLTDFLSKMVKLRSSYPHENEFAIFLTCFLRENGFRVIKQKVAIGRYNIFATLGSGTKAVLFYGHIDTVNVVQAKEWDTNPFKATIKNRKLFGLGASDMKGGIAAFLEATKNTTAYIKIFLAVDEENISEGAWKAVNERKDFFKDVELIISAEPSFGLGLNGITTGRTGRCIYEIIFQGTSEHIIKYKNAIDAIKKLSDFGSKLYAKRENMFNALDTIAQIRKIQGESKGMSVCGEAKAEIEVLLGKKDTVKSVRDKLQVLTDDEVKLKPRETPYLESYNFSTFPYKDLIAGIIRKNTGKKMILHNRKSVGDDNVLATLKIPVITWGPEGGNEHKANEFVNLDSVSLLSKMYKELLDNLHKNSKD